MHSRPTNSDDVIDSRDVEEAIEELEAMVLDETDQTRLEELDGKAELTDEEKEELNSLLMSTLDEDDKDELASLRRLRQEAEGYAPDWKYGATLIRDSYFESYARDFADDIGATKESNDWPYTCIDWARAAEELQQDYASVEFDGVTYWVR